MPSLPTGVPSVMPSAITLDITNGYSPSVMFPRETFFWRARIRLWFRRCFRRWVFFLFTTELATEMGFTDYCYTDGRDPSVTPLVLLLPTEFIDVTDGISPSAKLYNVVVNDATAMAKQVESNPKQREINGRIGRKLYQLLIKGSLLIFNRPSVCHNEETISSSFSCFLNVPWKRR